MKQTKYQQKLKIRHIKNVLNKQAYEYVKDLENKVRVWKWVAVSSMVFAASVCVLWMIGI